MYQYRLSTLLLAFVVVWSSLAVFGSVVGVVVAAILLTIAACVRSPELRPHLLTVILLIILCGLCLCGLLLPSLQSARESARRVKCLNNLKQIGLALLTYESANGQLPPAVACDKQGKAMHSWRTLILPQLERSDLYKAYRFREPWNGPNNSKLAATFLPIFCCPSDPPSGVGPQMTSYVAVTGPGTVWNDHHSAGPPRVMVVEVANSNIRRMEPRDLTLEEACRGVGNGSGPGISSYHVISGGFFYQDEVAGAHALFSDGTVRIIPAGLPPETLKGLFSGDEKAMRACTAYQRRVHWANCTALAVLILSYAVLLFRPRDKRPSVAEPEPPSPPAAPGGN